MSTVLNIAAHLGTCWRVYNTRNPIQTHPHYWRTLTSESRLVFSSTDDWSFNSSYSGSADLKYNSSNSRTHPIGSMDFVLRSSSHITDETWYTSIIRSIQRNHRIVKYLLAFDGRVSSTNQRNGRVIALHSKDVFHGVSGSLRLNSPSSLVLLPICTMIKENLDCFSLNSLFAPRCDYPATSFTQVAAAHQHSAMPTQPNTIQRCPK